MPRVTAHSGARKGPVARTFLSAPAARNAGPTNSAGSAPCANIKNCVVPQKYETYVYMCVLDLGWLARPKTVSVVLTQPRPYAPVCSQSAFRWLAALPRVRLNWYAPRLKVPSVFDRP